MTSGANIEWSEKYRPETLSAIVGNNKPVRDLCAWAKEWQHKIPDQRAAILYGKPGIGKTTAAHALAHDFDWEIIELNASDQRTAGVIRKVAGSASKTASIDGSIRLIVLDEADNIHGTADRGGAQALVKIIKNTSQPILLTANDLYGISQSIKDLCVPIAFRSLQSRSIIPVLNAICHDEGIACEAEALQRIAESAHGDIRSAINDLQAVAQGKSELHSEDVVVSARDPRDTIFTALKKIFKGKDIKEALTATYSIDETPDNLIQWIDENLPNQYRGRDLTYAMLALSRADIFLGRVQRRQTFRMWRYAGAMMSSGVAVSKSHEYPGARFMPPSRWRRLGRTKTSRQIRDAISEKISTLCQVSQRYARLNFLPFIRMLFADHDYAVHLAARMNLDTSEIAYVTGSKKDT
ncbi:MAG: replication factor C large subunit, partial [Euryarchaeota archaeon]|nr:replication factor C large subunit [Euryarchaeota archaeon]